MAWFSMALCKLMPLKWTDTGLSYISVWGTWFCLFVVWWCGKSWAQDEHNKELSHIHIFASCWCFVANFIRVTGLRCGCCCYQLFIIAFWPIWFVLSWVMSGSLKPWLFKAVAMCRWRLAGTSLVAILSRLVFSFLFVISVVFVLCFFVG